ncbi:adenylate/guanylate cyclase domain-containing protein [Aeromicrobium sp.]|uniref:adenylate/guanylate cyclase domain-containing protein n=1 Tax=Aeromicrobium sp. TaxID=1871063 RepID=UPI003D6BDD1C
MTADEPGFDPGDVIRAITELMLGEAPHLKRADVSELSGVNPDIARQRWRALGFPEADDDDAAFTEADVEALRLTQELIELGVIEPDTEQAFIRTIGRSFARLAEWQVRAFLGSMGAGSQEDVAAGDLDELEKVVPLGEQVQAYVWRRHLINAASRLLLTDSADVDASPMCVGFADIVGYTSRSRKMSRRELTDMVERFDEVAAGLITDHHGHVVKTIGDEVLFVVDDPKQAALLALALLDEHEADGTFPEVRIGLAHGNVLNHMGDVFGPVVNVASRLTSVARPGSAVVDREMAEHLRDDDDLRLKRMRRTSVKGYEHLEPWSLKRPREKRDPAG